MAYVAYAKIAKALRQDAYDGAEEHIQLSYE